MVMSRPASGIAAPSVAATDMSWPCQRLEPGSNARLISPRVDWNAPGSSAISSPVAFIIHTPPVIGPMNLRSTAHWWPSSSRKPP